MTDTSDRESAGKPSPRPKGPGESLPRASAITIRFARPEDQEAVTHLIKSSRLPGDVADDAEDQSNDIFDLRKLQCNGGTDEGDDGADVPSAACPAALWVAELGSAGVVGMVGLRHVSDDVAEMRRLRVDPEHRGKGIGGALVKHAIGVCVERSYLKVILDTFIERTSAIRLFERAGFLLARSRPSENGEHPRLEFYLDLYRDQPERDR